MKQTNICRLSGDIIIDNSIKIVTKNNNRIPGLYKSFYLLTYLFAYLNKIMFVRTRSLSNALTFFERAYLAPKYTEVIINTSLTSSVM